MPSSPLSHRTASLSKLCALIFTYKAVRKVYLRMFYMRETSGKLSIQSILLNRCILANKAEKKHPPMQRLIRIGGCKEERVKESVLLRELYRANGSSLHR